MKTAEQMIEKRAFIKKEMDKNLPKEQSDALWEEATRRLKKILDKYSTLPKGVRLHTERSIFPASAIYLTLKEAVGEVPAVTINYGVFIQTIVDFTIIAFCIFVAIKAINKLKREKPAEPETPAEPSEDILLLREIRDSLKK